MTRLRLTLAMLAAALALTGCNEQAGTPASNGEAATGQKSDAAKTRFDTVLESDLRAADRDRDEFRHPGQTLEFFDVQPGHTVIDYAPGGGWYTRILAPYLQKNGTYYGMGFAPEFPKETIAALGPDFVSRVEEGGKAFSSRQADSLGEGFAEDDVRFFFSNAIPDNVTGQADRVLVFRMMHNLKRWGIAEREVQAMFDTLKPGGKLGVVQHRAKADAPDAYVDGSKGYLRQAEVVAIFEKAGFELEAESEINANPNDTADYEAGVWTLPPSYAKGDEDRERYEAIGESDRMTLLFVKPEAE